MDTEVWKQVWSDVEKVNYHSTPMFGIEAVKSKNNTGWIECEMMKNENKFQIAGLEIPPGERWQGTLMIGGGEFVLPAAVLHGEKRERSC